MIFKNRKRILIASALLSLLTLSACSGANADSLPFSESQVAPSLSESQVASSLSEETPVAHACTFRNYDGTILWSTTVDDGDTVTYQGPAPTHEDTIASSETIHWTFARWDKSLENIEEDTVFTAVFRASNVVECTFVDYDGTVIYSYFCLAGSKASYPGDSPSRPDDDDGAGTVVKYAFRGWDKPFDIVESDTVFTAQYVEVGTYVECKFLNYDGTLLYTDFASRFYSARYHGPTPSKPRLCEGTTITEYTFEGWDKTLYKIEEPTTFVAQYSATTSTGYKVTFLDFAGAEIYSDYYKPGEDAVYSGELPFSYDEETVFLFAGWDGSLENIQGPTTLRATYHAVPRRYNGEYPQKRVTDENLIEALESVTTVDKQGYFIYEGEKYTKKEAYNVEVSDSYTPTFSDGTVCKNGETYWFKVEPIRWKVLSRQDDDLFLTSEFLLHCKSYHKFFHNLDANDNRYSGSTIRTWLNREFLDTAFFYDDSHVKVTAVDNSPETTGAKTNPYACETTNDKIFLLSYADVRNAEYGFATNEDRLCDASDYAVATGAQRDADWGGACWWTRSPSYMSATYANAVLETPSRQITRLDNLSTKYVELACGVRPALHLDLG